MPAQNLKKLLHASAFFGDRALVRCAAKQRPRAVRHSVLTIGIERRALKRLVSAAIALTLLASCWLPVANPRFANAAHAADQIDSTTPSKLGVPASALPDVGVPAGQLVTADGRVLWARGADKKRAMASLTKIMTAVVALEHADLSETVTISASAGGMGESSALLTAGDTVVLDDLLDALLVKSGNDASLAIAEHVAGSEDRFVVMMNKKAAALGLSRTHFVNPHGLDEKGHYSSAGDMAVLARYAMQNERFREIVAAPSIKVRREGKRVTLENTNLLLSTYEGATGVKTGWTGNAGYCLIGSAQRNGAELYAIVMGTGSEQKRLEATRALLDWGFAHYRAQSLISEGTVVGRAPVLDYLDVSVDGAASKDTTAAVFDLAGPIERSVKMADARAPIKKGERVGVATFTQGGNVVATVPLVAMHAIERPGFFERIGIAAVRLWQRIRG